MSKVKILFNILILLSLIFFISCPQEAVKGTLWSGELDGFNELFGVEDRADIEAQFKFADTLKIYITYEVLGEKETISADGRYTLAANNNLSADLLKESGATLDDFDVEFNGVLKNWAGTGEGEYTIDFDDGTEIKGNLELTKESYY